MRVKSKFTNDYEKGAAKRASFLTNEWYLSYIWYNYARRQ